jgi:hypothetical protein
MPPAFVYNPQRDASKAIRGFYYQIQLTILRWLELAPDAFLVCECGEDIDHVSKLADSDPATQTRLLEQVKVRSRITLRNRDAITAIARFYEATRSNPSIRVLYRFATTATIGHETGIQFPRRLPGIAAWQAIQEGLLDIEEATAFFDTWRTILTNAPCPPDLDPSSLVELQRYVDETSNGDLINLLIMRFEWATGLDEPPRLLSTIHERLLAQRRAENLEEAADVTDVLIMHVLRLLTQPGLKRLTVDTLHSVIRERPLTGADRQTLRTLTALVERAEAYLAHMTHQLGGVIRRVEDLEGLPARVDHLIGRVEGLESQTVISTTVLPAPDEPPLLGAVLSRRSPLVEMLADELRRASWISIEGAAGMGKTWVAALLCERTASLWVHLRGDRLPPDSSPSTAQFSRLLDLHLLRHTNTTA